MELYKELYVSEELKKNKDIILHKIRNKEALLNIYIIILSPNERNQLEIYNVALNLQKAFSLEGLFIVGVARGFHNAVKIVEKMVQTVYDETNGANIKTYIQRRQEELKESEV